MATNPTYILQLEALDGTERVVSITDGDGHDCLAYAIVEIAGGRAVIIDNGYRSREEAKKAWPEAK